MNLQERLLRSEISHLGEIIQTLSYELIMLQEFVKQEHGSKYEKFRVRYLSYGQPSSSSRPSQPPPRKETKSARPAGARVDDDYYDEAPMNSNGENEDNDNESVVDAENGNNMSAESDESGEDPLRESYSLGNGRKSKIWKYFDKITHRNNKFSARCHICQGLVSCRAVRMVDHRIKCKRNMNMYPNSTTTAKSEAMEDSAHKVFNEGMDYEDVGHPSETAPDENSFRKSDDDRSSEDEIEEIERPSGPHADRIWKYYEVVVQNKLKKAKCISCGKFVSPKAVRMRQHKGRCKGPDIKPAAKEKNTNTI